MYAAGQAIAIRQARKHVKKQPSGDQSHPVIRATPGSGERFPRFPQQVHPKHHGAQGDHRLHQRHQQHPPYGGRVPHINGKISWHGVAAEGKAAWQEQRGVAGAATGHVLGGQRHSLRPRPPETEAAASHRKATEAHRRWMKRNRSDEEVRDASSGEYSYYGGFRAGGAATALLYVGLGTVAVGLVISFVGLGEKGFKTLELRMIGPGLVLGGLLLCLLRIFLCTCCPPPFPPPPCCLRRDSCFKHWRQRHGRPRPAEKCPSEDEEAAAASSRYGFEEASLLKGGKRKKVSPEVLPTASSSQVFGPVGADGKRKVVRQTPPGLQMPPAALHVHRRAPPPPTMPQTGSGRIPPPATYLPNQVVVGEEERKGGVAEGGSGVRLGGGTSKGSGASRGRTNKVWSEVASGVPTEGRWVAPDEPRSEGEEKKRRAKSAEGGGGGKEVVVGGEGSSMVSRGARGSLVEQDAESHCVGEGDSRNRPRGLAGPSRRTPERRLAHRHSSSRPENELVLSPAALGGL